VTFDRRTLAFALLVLISASVAAQTSSPQGEQATNKNKLVERAKTRCKLNRGVDCDSPEGLKEWILAERSREEAVLDGSRHLLPFQSRPAPLRR
jgi:hypothetical protein